MKLALLSALAGSAAAFAPASTTKTTTSLNDASFNPEFQGEIFDPMGFGKMHTINAFPGMFPHTQYLEESEIKHGRMAMLGWTGVWTTEGLGWHFPGAPVAEDWSTALPVWAKADPGGFGAVLLFIMIAEGEGVSHAGDNFRGVSKKIPGDMGFDWMGMTRKLSDEKVERYKTVEKKNGRAAMIAMASLMAMKAIPGSVPFMDSVAGPLSGL